jgi:hypothetical protein
MTEKTSTNVFELGTLRLETGEEGTNSGDRSCGNISTGLLVLLTIIELVIG